MAEQTGPWVRKQWDLLVVGMLFLCTAFVWTAGIVEHTSDVLDGFGFDTPSQGALKSLIYAAVVTLPVLLALLGVRRVALSFLTKTPERKRITFLAAFLLLLQVVILTLEISERFFITIETWFFKEAVLTMHQAALSGAVLTVLAIMIILFNKNRKTSVTAAMTFLILCLQVSMIPTIAFGDDIYEDYLTIDYNHDYPYQSGLAAKWKTGKAFIDYSDTMLDVDSRKPNLEIAKLAAGLTAAACRGNDEDGNLQSGSYYIQNAFDALDVDDSGIFNYKEGNIVDANVVKRIKEYSNGQYSEEELSDLIRDYWEKQEEKKDDVGFDEHAFAIAHKELNDGKYAVFVILRGTESGVETIGDAVQKKAGKGFYEYKTYEYYSDFKDKVYNTLKWYIAEHKEIQEANAEGSGNVKFLISGHSLGGAGANLLAAQIDHMIDDESFAQEMGFAFAPQKTDVFAYTFGALNTLDSDEDADKEREKYSNIINMFNELDTFGPKGRAITGKGLRIEKPSGGKDSFKRKFGQIISFEENFEAVFTKNDSNDNFACHNMQGYYYAVASNLDQSLTKEYKKVITMIMDESSSMEGVPIKELKKAGKTFADLQYENACLMSAIGFSTEPRTLINMTDDTEAINRAVDQLIADGSTDIGLALDRASSHLLDVPYNQFFVLMSDGYPESGLEGDELIEHAKEIRDRGVQIFCLGFLQEVTDSIEAQRVLSGIASPGCYYSIDDAEDLQYFFKDISDQINGTRYYYIRVECPVDVTVSYGGETLTSVDSEANDHARTEFGTLTMEQNEADGDLVKVLRLKEGPEYNIQIEGYDSGQMAYSIGFADKNGEYKETHAFQKIPVTDRTEIRTVAERRAQSTLFVDQNGDGKADMKYLADKDGSTEVPKDTRACSVAFLGYIVLLLLFFGLIIRRDVRKYRIAAAYVQCTAETVNQKKTSVTGLTEGGSKMFCEKCGAQIGAGAKFCEKCGARVERIVDEDSSMS